MALRFSKGLQNSTDPVTKKMPTEANLVEMSIEDLLEELRRTDEPEPLVCSRHNEVCCVRKVQKATANYGSMFFSCPFHGCDFFLWKADLKVAQDLHQTRYGNRTNHAYKRQTTVEFSPPYSCKHPDDKPVLPAMFGDTTSLVMSDTC